MNAIDKDHYSMSQEDYKKFLDEFNSKKQGFHTFSLLMQKEPGGEITSHVRVNQPCYGEMRKYGEISTLPSTSKPSDLHHPFPEGRPVAVMVHSNYLATKMQAFDSKSPWIKGFGSIDNIIFHHDKNIFTLIDTRIDPSVFVLMLRNIRSLDNLDSRIDKDKNNYYYKYLWSPFYNNIFSDFRLFCNQSPINASGGTWYDGYDYNRWWNESLFITLKDIPDFDKDVYFQRDLIDMSSPYIGNKIKDWTLAEKEIRGL